jgi:hypothetical protein
MQQEQPISDANESIGDIPNDSGTPFISEGAIIMDIDYVNKERQDTHAIKRICADLFDTIQEVCGELKDGDMERHTRKQRSKAICFTFLETFCMNAVKALSYSNEFVGEPRKERNLPEITDGMIAMRYEKTDNKGVDWVKLQAASLYDNMETEMTYRNNAFTAAQKKYYDDLAIKQQQEYELLSPEEKEKFTQNRANTIPPPWSEELIMEHRKLSAAREAMGDAIYNLKQFQLYAVKALTR